MTTIVIDTPKRKTLSLKTKETLPKKNPRNRRKLEPVPQALAVYMVWREGGDMPTRVYTNDERHIAIKHAIGLNKQTGARFHVLKSHRAFGEVKP